MVSSGIVEKRGLHAGQDDVRWDYKVECEDETEENKRASPTVVANQVVNSASNIATESTLHVCLLSLAPPTVSS
jgi:hypothetical protein